MQIEDTDRATLQRLLDASREFTNALEAFIESPGSEHLGAMAPYDGGLPVWDPLRDTPIVEPKVKGTRSEQDWCSLVYLGAIWSINVREGRGADRDEIRDHAIRAGYRDGRAVTAWSKGEGATRNDADKRRWMTDAGKRTVLDYAARCRVRLPDDVTTDWPGV